ncbi:ATP-binding cassette domain-containing protein [uncultured Thiodictyon sp.]|uniref:ATP-binding cassette domain-containing protein n=1 Tax=uncultured Thiodictyon sp. TaxID=1846217 RepID=UPI0025F2083A|nr:ATP-binding cassette domain-containing protein [uncultured Thiodictyon sp.]
MAIEGPSGGGKTTLLGLMAGLDRPSYGRVRFAGQEVPDAAAWSRLRAARIGIVFQDYALVPTLTALENVELPMFGQVSGTAERRRRAYARLLERPLGARGAVRRPGVVCAVRRGPSKRAAAGIPPAAAIIAPRPVDDCWSQ